MAIVTNPTEIINMTHVPRIAVIDAIAGMLEELADIAPQGFTNFSDPASIPLVLYDVAKAIGLTGPELEAAFGLTLVTTMETYLNDGR